MVASRLRPGARSAGFTLPELMVTVLVMATLAAVAMPSLSDMMASQRAKSISGDLLTALTRTRSEAIKRNTEVTLQPAASTGWQSGWVIPNPTDSGNQLEVHGPILNVTVQGPDSVVYLATGRMKGSASRKFDISAAGVGQRRCVQVDLSGRPFQTSGACP